MLAKLKTGNLGILLLSIYLILAGVLSLWAGIGASIATVQAVLALAAGICLLIGR